MLCESGRPSSLVNSLNEILEILTQNSDEGQRLRQSTPFSGVLSQQERLDIFRHYEPAGA